MIMFLLLGKIITWSALASSTALTMSWVDGFMVCPPETTYLTPRSSKTSLIPSPTETEMKAYFSFSLFFIG